jgi:hypothetical protein
MHHDNLFLHRYDPVKFTRKNLRPKSFLVFWLLLRGNTSTFGLPSLTLLFSSSSAESTEQQCGIRVSAFAYPSLAFVLGLFFASSLHSHILGIGAFADSSQSI